MTPSGHVLRLVRARLGSGALLDATATAEGDVLVVQRARLLDVLAYLKADSDADVALLVDVTAVDREATEPERFEVRYLLRSPRLGYRVQVVVRVGGDDAMVPSIVGVHPGAEWLERELFEMFGIYVDGHPHLRPLLLYAGFEGHPLRRDYRAAKAQPLVPLLSPERPALVVEDVAS